MSKKIKETNKETDPKLIAVHTGLTLYIEEFYVFLDGIATDNDVKTSKELNHIELPTLANKCIETLKSYKIIDSRGMLSNISKSYHAAYFVGEYTNIQESLISDVHYDSIVQFKLEREYDSSSVDICYLRYETEEEVACRIKLKEDLENKTKKASEDKEKKKLENERKLYLELKKKYEGK
jgi:hypothetical protein